VDGYRRRAPVQKSRGSSRSVQSSRSGGTCSSKQQLLTSPVDVAGALKPLASNCAVLIATPRCFCVLGNIEMTWLAICDWVVRCAATLDSNAAYAGSGYLSPVRHLPPLEQRTVPAGITAGLLEHGGSCQLLDQSPRHAADNPLWLCECLLAACSFTMPQTRKTDSLLLQLI
jgi:hypothetical protein